MVNVAEPAREWWRPIAAALAGGLVSGIGSFYVAAQPAVSNVEQSSLASNVFLCEASNENRRLLRHFAEGLLAASPVPPDAPPALAAYIHDRNEARRRERALIEDTTRELDCNSGVIGKF